MSTLVDNLGVICLAIDSTEKNALLDRTKLQKMIYFSKYLNWDVDPYRLHFYGPYSNEVADSLNIATDNDIVNETDPNLGSNEYVLTETGDDFLERFLTDICNTEKATKTRKLFNSLAKHTKDELELVATIDFVSNNTPKLSRIQLVEKVSMIKDNFSIHAIQSAYKIWKNIQKQIQILHK